MKTETPEAGVSVYRDGSGLASAIRTDAVNTIKDTYDSLDRIKEFIDKHRLVLAGVKWYFWAHRMDIEIHHAYYRREYAAPSDIARLFPLANWTRKVDKICEKIDWIATVDGVDLRITCAEAWKKPKPSAPRDGSQAPIIK